jgi:glycosyltransferase involved in cell wall biosynthesis
MYHGAFASVLGRRMIHSARPNAPRLYWSLHQTPEPNLYGEKYMTKRIISRLKRYSYSLPAEIIYASHSAKSAHEALGFAPTNACVIPNGIDAARFCPDDSARAYTLNALGFPEERRKNALLVGRFARWNPMKDYPCLLRGFALFRREFPDAVLICAGKGVSFSNPAFADMAKKSGVSEWNAADSPSVYALGFREDVPRLMAGMDATVSPSSMKEAWPLSIAESMASAVSCIASDVGDSAEIVGNSAMLIPAGDWEALGLALGRFFSLPAEERRRIGNAARKRIMTHFPIERTAEAYAEWIRHT